MNVYTINSGNNGCCYVRILLPTFANGFISDKTSIRSESCKDVKQISANLEDADVVVFHRPETPEALNMINQLKANGKKVVVDNDDTFKIEDNHPLAEWSSKAARLELKSRDKYFDQCAEKADLITTTTEALAKEYREINDNVIVLPNCVDPMDWDKPLKNKTEKVRIGLVGSVSYAYDYAHIKDVLRELSDRDDVQLVLFGLGDAKHQKENPLVTEFFKNEYEFWGSLDIEQIPWCDIADYPDLLNEARLDIMLIPRRQNYFNTCKSNVKVLEAAMCGVPCIAQSFAGGPYEEFENERHIILIKDNNNWDIQVNRLIKDKELRRRIGGNIHEYILDNYNIENKAHLWVEAYEKICNR